MGSLSPPVSGLAYISGANVMTQLHRWWGLELVPLLSCVFELNCLPARAALSQFSSTYCGCPLHCICLWFQAILGRHLWCRLISELPLSVLSYFSWTECAPLLFYGEYSSSTGYIGPRMKKAQHGSKTNFF